MPGIDYSKWDNLDDSDDDVPSDGALIPNQKDQVQHKDEGSLTKRLSEALTGAVKPSQREQVEVLSRFLSVQCKGEEVCNIYRHCDIIAMTSQFPQLMTADTVDLLVDAQQTISKGTEDVDRTEVLQIIVEGINTLEACMQADGAVNLFEQICTPQTPAQVELRQQYAKLEFARKRVFRSILGDELMDEMESTATLSDSSSSEVYLLVGGSVVLILAVACLAYYMYVHAKTGGSSSGKGAEL
jgi:hypothetical protein